MNTTHSELDKTIRIIGYEPYDDQDYQPLPVDMSVKCVSQTRYGRSPDHIYTSFDELEGDIESGKITKNDNILFFGEEPETPVEDLMCQGFDLNDLPPESVIEELANKHKFHLDYTENQ